MLIANSAAILTDAFPADQRGLALGINQVAAHRRPVHRPGRRRPAGGDRLARGVLGQRAGRRLRHGLGLPQAARDRRAAPAASIDWWGNITFAVGPERDPGRASPTASSPTAATRWAGRTRGCSARWSAASLLLVAFVVDRDAGSREPMFQLGLFRIRAFAAGNIAGLLGVDRAAAGCSSC